MFNPHLFQVFLRPSFGACAPPSPDLTFYAYALLRRVGRLPATFQILSDDLSRRSRATLPEGESFLSRHLRATLPEGESFLSWHSRATLPEGESSYRHLRATLPEGESFLSRHLRATLPEGESFLSRHSRATLPEGESLFIYYVNTCLVLFCFVLLYILWISLYGYRFPFYIKRPQNFFM